MTNRRNMMKLVAGSVLGAVPLAFAPASMVRSGSPWLHDQMRPPITIRLLRDLFAIVGTHSDGRCFFDDEWMISFIATLHEPGMPLNELARPVIEASSTLRVHLHHRVPADYPPWQISRRADWSPVMRWPGQVMWTINGPDCAPLAAIKPQL